MVDEVARLIEDRRSGRNPGLIQQATQKRDLETTSVFSPSIFDDDDITLCVDDSDDDDLIIQEVESITKRAEEVVVVLSDSDADEDGDDIVIVEPEELVTIAPTTDLEKSATEPDLDLSPKENTDTDKVVSANDEPTIEKTAAVSEQPNQDDSEIASVPHMDKNPEEPKETQETPLPETRGIFDDSDDDDDEDQFEETVPDKPNNDSSDLTEETLSEALPNSNNWMDWDDEWAEMEEKPVPCLLEFMDRPETPDEVCDKVAAPSNTTERYSIFEKPAPFGSWCTEPFNFDGSDEETEAAGTPRSVSEGDSSITIKHEQISEVCSESASASSQKVDTPSISEDNLDTFTEKSSLVPEKEVGEPEIDDEPRESEEQNAEESKDLAAVENQSLNDKTDDVPDEIVGESCSGIPQQADEGDVDVPATDVLDDKLQEDKSPIVPEGVAAEDEGKNIEETPAPPDKPIDDQCKETAEPVAEKCNITETPVDEEVEKPPEAQEQATTSSSDAQVNSEPSAAPKEDNSCVIEAPQKPEEPLSSKNVFCVRSLVMEIEKLPLAKLSNGETIVEEEEDEDNDVGFCLADININIDGFSDGDSDSNDDEDYRQSTIVDGMEVPQRDGLGWSVSPISKVGAEAIVKSEKLTEGVLQSNQDSVSGFLDIWLTICDIASLYCEATVRLKLLYPLSKFAHCIS